MSSAVTESDCPCYHCDKQGYLEYWANWGGGGDGPAPLGKLKPGDHFACAHCDKQIETTTGTDITGDWDYETVIVTTHDGTRHAGVGLTHETYTSDRGDHTHEYLYVPVGFDGYDLGHKIPVADIAAIHFAAPWIPASVKATISIGRPTPPADEEWTVVHMKPTGLYTAA